MDFDLNISNCGEDWEESFSGDAYAGDFVNIGSGPAGEAEGDRFSVDSVELDSRFNENDCDSAGPDIGIEREIDDVLSLHEVESSINVGCAIDTLDEVFALYSAYARMVGFSVRKGTQGKLKDKKTISSKVHHCNCEGPPDNKASKGRLAAFKKQSFRTNCTARLRVCRANSESRWVVSKFSIEHNHELFNPSETYLLRSARKIGASHKTLLMAMKSSGIGVSRAYWFLENEAGNRENIGFTRKDVYNELNRESSKVAKVANADANKLMEFLTEKGLCDPSLYWKVKVSDEGRLQNLLFRDSRCLVDYQVFGDVLSVDATYKTNKYDLICIPIVGINHHRTNVMFAIAFLSNEKTESYEWLFSTFLESMYQREPSIIFSDQDHALMNAVDVTFRDAKHRLCQWHVNKNAGKQFGKLNHDYSFKRLWYRCMNGCENGEEFEATWATMIEQYQLTENRWFSSMYKLRKRWSSAFTRDKFTGGLHATSRSEVTNKVLKDLCASTSSLHEFVLGFERLLKNWRRQEFEEDALSRGMPGMFVQSLDILVPIGEICTRTIFKAFEFEALSSVAVRVTEEPLDLNVEFLEFKVYSKLAMKGYHVVKVNQTTKIGSCSCHMWEAEGVICRHLFRVYFDLHLDKLPDEMLLHRWRRVAKERIQFSERSFELCGTNKLSNMLFVNHNVRRVYEMLTEFKDDADFRTKINERINSMIVEVKNMKKSSLGEDEAGPSGTNFKEPLHRPLNNPKSNKKRSYRRPMCSKDWDSGSTGGFRRSKYNVEVNDFLGSQEIPYFESTQVSNLDIDGSADRFSLD